MSSSAAGISVRTVLAAVAACLAECDSGVQQAASPPLAAPPPPKPAAVDATRLVGAGHLPTDPRAHESTPLIVDGKLYVTGTWSRVFAFDAASGASLWSYDPKVPGHTAVNGCCDVVNRGVAVWNGKVYVGTLDGRLVALDATTGIPVWDVRTTEPGSRYTMTGAPRVIKGKVLIGNGGAEMGVRGYVPGDPAKPFESPALEMAAKTWKGQWWKYGGGGTVWDSMAYDPKLDLLYIDLNIDGHARQVIMQAPKNAFFYVIDRANGQFISATGRPIETPQARYGETGKPWNSVPGPGGTHNWQPMAFSPLTVLVYIPVSALSFPYFPDQHFSLKKLGWNTGADFNAGSLPQDDKIKAAAIAASQGHLAAWDPVAQKEAWRIPQGHPWNGGVLATAGNLVFEGTSRGEFNAYQADTGAPLRSVQLHTGILAPPVTYQVGNDQYIAVVRGWGGAAGLAAGEIALASHTSESNVPRLMVFKLNGTDVIPTPPKPPERVLQPPPASASAAMVANGKTFFNHNCGVCHGDCATSGGVLPDLRYSVALADNDDLAKQKTAGKPHKVSVTQ